MGESRSVYRVLWEILKEETHLEDLSVYGSIIIIIIIIIILEANFTGLSQKQPLHTVPRVCG
jgi:hypothetical protein